MKNRSKKQQRRKQGRNVNIPTHLQEDRLPEIARLECLDLMLPDLSPETDICERQVAVVTSCSVDNELARRIEELIKEKGYSVTIILPH